MYLVVLVCVLLVVALCIVRFSPSDIARWHQPIQGAENIDMIGGAVRVSVADADALQRVNAAATALERTQVLAGSVQDGFITYITRSKWIGFPDFTTVEYANGQLKMFARLRFGRSDFGVNAERLKGLLAAAEGR